MRRASLRTKPPSCALAGVKPASRGGGNAPLRAPNASTRMRRASLRTKPPSCALVGVKPASRGGGNAPLRAPNASTAAAEAGVPPPQPLQVELLAGGRGARNRAPGQVGLVGVVAAH